MIVLFFETPYYVMDYLTLTCRWKQGCVARMPKPLEQPPESSRIAFAYTLILRALQGVLLAGAERKNTI
ncbi:MAG: hypothetical protein ACOX3Q_12815 [Clostridia bacterium]